MQLLPVRSTLMPRPKKQIDLEQLKKLLSLQCTKIECAAFFEVTKPTLDARIRDAGYEGFQQFADIYRQPGRISLRRHQWKNAESGNVTMQIWLGKQWLAQTDKVESRTELTTPAPHILPDQQAKAVREWAKGIQEKVRTKRSN